MLMASFKNVTSGKGGGAENFHPKRTPFILSRCYGSRDYLSDDTIIHPTVTKSVFYLP